MTRPASYNTTWANAGQQIAGEGDAKTQEFMKTGWEGGSDKKPPHAPTQNYHMQKTDLTLQEIERQGLLSWRGDVPYQKGARVFWHGSTFQALKDTAGTEPQGSGDNGVWYLVPIQNYPSSYESVKGLGTAAKKNEGDFERSGSVSGLKNSLSDSAFLNTDKADWNTLGDTRETIATAHHVYGLRSYVYESNEKLKSAAFNDASAFEKSGSVQALEATLCDSARLSTDKADWNTVGDTRNTIATAHHVYGLRSYVYELEKKLGDAAYHNIDTTPSMNMNPSDVAVPSTSALVDLREHTLYRDTSRRCGFINGNRFDPYLEHVDGETYTAVPLARLVYLEEIKRSLDESKVTRDGITTAGYENNNSSKPYMTGPTGTTYLQERIKSTRSGQNGEITIPNVITFQYGTFSYPDFNGTGSFTITFPKAFSSVAGFTCTVDSAQDVSWTRQNLSDTSCVVRVHEFSNGTFGGTICWQAWGFL